MRNLYTPHQRHFYGIEFPVRGSKNPKYDLKVNLAAFLTIDSRLAWLKKKPEYRNEITAKDAQKLLTFQHVSTITYSFK